MQSTTFSTPRLGGTLAIAVFVVMLICFVVESQMTQYVQTTLAYRQPFFLFYLVHSSFCIIFPLHLSYLVWTTGHSTRSLVRGVTIAVSQHLSPIHRASPKLIFPYTKFFRLCLAMTVGITLPGLLWFAAVSLAPVSDVTAIWNTNAFFAYIISVKLLNLRWEQRKLLAVVLATLGTLVVVYGGSATASGDKPPHDLASAEPNKPKAPLVGNLLTLAASFGYGLYQVLYKIYAALPSDPEVTSERRYQHIPDQDDVDDEATLTATADTSFETTDIVYPPPFGLYPNALTSIVGFFTMGLLWMPIPILHAWGIERFRLPPDWKTIFAISGIALSGVGFNASFMVLLGVWGPIIVSVGNLLTIVLVLISDIIFGAGVEVLTFWSFVGSGIIVVAFGVLAFDMFVKERASATDDD